MNDLQQLLTELGIPYAEGGSHRHVREGWIGLDCPWCGSVGRWHLGVHLESLRASCWVCGPRDLWGVLGLLTPFGPAEIRRRLKSLPRGPRAAPNDRLERGRLLIPSGLGSLKRPHRAWLRERGLDPDRLVKDWGLQGYGPLGKLAWRIWAPVTLGGETVSWTTRTIGDDEQRWLHAKPEEEVWPIKTLLYGWDYVGNTAIVVEGPSDVWRIGPGAVASFGLVLTAPQMQLLSTVPRRVICFDNEPAAQQAARRVAKQLAAFPGETMVVELDSADPGEASDEEVRELQTYLTM